MRYFDTGVLLKLYRTLREGVTRFYLRGGGALDLQKIEALAAGQP